MENADNEELVDYLEEYPYLDTLYAGNAFSKDYKGARGHAYTLQTCPRRCAHRPWPTVCHARPRR